MYSCNLPFRYIKMSSPHLNNLIIIGCMLTYLSVIFLGLDSSLSSVEAFPYGKIPAQPRGLDKPISQRVCKISF